MEQNNPREPSTPNIDQLAAEQQGYGQEIQRVIANYKKDPAARKTTAAYYKDRLQRLETSWTLFDTVHREISSLTDVPKNHPYFTSYYYEEIKKVYDQYKHHFTIKSTGLREPMVAQDTQHPTPQDNDDIPSLAANQNDPRPGEMDPFQSSAGQNFQPETTTKCRNTASKGAIPKMPKLRVEDSNKRQSADAFNPDSLEIIRTIRRQKSVIQSLLRVITTIEGLEDVHYPKSFFELKIQSITQYWAEVETQHHSIWEKADDPTTLGYDLVEYINLEEKVQQCLISLSAKLEVCSPVIHQTQPIPTASTMLKLPKITLPKFDGDYTKWHQFCDLFKQMVHNQPMSNCQKMWYLKANLSGEAERLLRHFTLSDENYTAAWQTLQERYENSRLLVAALINKLLAQASHSNDIATASAIRTLHDTTKESLLGLESMGISTTNWDPLLLHILLKKLDRNTHTLYEQSLSNPKGLQSIKDFLAFLEVRFQSLEALGNKGRNTENNHGRNLAAKSLTSVATLQGRCISCNDNHPLYQCRQFLQRSPDARLSLLRKYDVCVNCLRKGHQPSKCTLRGCTRCGRKHNTLLHIEPTKKAELLVTKGVKESSGSTPVSDTCRTQPAALASSSSQGQNSYVLLSTARVKLLATNGKEIECRAILDSGSQINLVTERAVKKLQLTPTNESIFIQGIGHGKQRSQRRVSLKLQSRINGFSTRLEAFVLTQIISPQPTQSLDISTWTIPQNIKLADPTFDRPGNIDLLLGAEFYHELLSIGQIRLGQNLPTLQNTVFGWVVAGKLNQARFKSATCGVCTEENIDKAIEKFWKVEEFESIQRNNFTLAEKRCETHFSQTSKRNSDGRFVVRLPFSGEPSTLGHSKDLALRRYMALERKLSKNNELYQQYNSFMEEYLNLGHMEEVDINSIPTPHYFLPHHGVSKPESSTTKLRVVFDASAKTSSNVSLNDLLLPGPVIQEDLFSILLRFRLPRFVFTADIEKMYRQVILHEEDRRYHLILWRSKPDQNLKCYQLRTVTYGTSSAPYLATKCLQQLAQTEASRFPEGAEVVQRDFYVDDVMTGANSLSSARDIQSQLTEMLKEGGFKLRKWCANHPSLLQHIPQRDQEIQLDFTDEKDSSIKTLGLTWTPKSDQFCVKTSWISPHKTTKRSVASDIARLFDPLGVMAPVIVTAKMFLQQLWELKLDWDASLPMEMHTRWSRFRDSLRALNEIQFPRHMFAAGIPKSMQIHAFADASEKAYGAAIYMRSISKEGGIIVRLLCAKSRVAPTKKLTLPRLELCAAKLAADLVQRTKQSLRLENVVTYIWTDSEIVLAWINSTSNSYQTFVANRIAAIQEITIPQQWRHVSSKENPADVLSRGIAPEKLKSCNLWFYGPPYLHGEESVWPPAYTRSSQCEEERKRSALPITAKEKTELVHFIHNINHGNSFRKLQRVIGYMLRFIGRIKKSSSSVQQALTTMELDKALLVIIRQIQEGDFHEDIRHLSKYGEVNKASALSSLAPFLDEDQVLRVGGRLENSSLPYDARHPILLPYSSEFTKLLMVDIHNENHHVGPQGLLSITRQRFWPIKGKSIARSVVQHCLRCVRGKPKFLSQIMGNLPSIRTQPARPFVNSGVDFCGPIWVHYKTRGKRPQKAYVAVFCCFATKAVHLELVSDLSTDAFIGSLKRFISRRGHCRNLYCDNATNFVGAKNQLKELDQSIQSNQSQEKIMSVCSRKGIDFHFIPPRAPHFGGLWEAAVKSAKHLLLRTVFSASLTYEELETVIIEIEAILNSRPLTSMSSNPNDLAALTPGHFLIGEPLTTQIDAQAQPLKTSLLTRWKLVSHLKQEFWRRWVQEYLHELQHRYKWKQRAENIKPGTVVLIKEDHTPIMKWPLGRIVEVHKGEDGNIRVVDLQTERGIFRRPIHKLAPLPCETETENELATNPDDETEQCPVESQSKRQNTDYDAPEPSTSASESPRKKTRTSFSSSMLTFLFVCLIVPAIRGGPVEVTQFGTELGIYFENLGTVNLITTEWKLVVYYDLQPYWMEFMTLTNGTKALQHLCSQIDQKSSCQPLIQQFQQLQDELSRDDELLSTQHNATRKRRGVLNIVGNVANSLFGVLDSQYADEMSKTITSIKENEQHLVHLLRNQTSVVDSTINIIRQDQKEVERKFQAIDNQIAQLINRINTDGREEQQGKLQRLFTSLALQMTLIVGNLQRIHAAIMDILTDSHHGRINPLLLSPHQLKQEIMVIRNHLPISAHLPLGSENILQLYGLMTAETGMANNHLIFQLRLPLVSEDRFELFRILPIPNWINDTFVAILPDSQFVAISPHRDRYYPVRDQELASCITIRGMNYLCKQLHPVYNRGAGTSSCEIEFFNNTPKLPQCRLTHLTQKPFWVQLFHNNQWIFAVRNKTLINVVCNEEAFPMYLNGSGLLKLQPNCVIKGNLITIRGHEVFSNNIRTSYTRLGLEFQPDDQNQLPMIAPEGHHYQTQLKTLEELQKRINSLDLPELPNKIYANTIHHFTVGYLALFIIIIIALYLGWTSKTQMCKRRPSKPQPAPRNRESFNFAVEI